MDAERQRALDRGLIDQFDTLSGESHDRLDQRPWNALYERPQTLALLGRLDGLDLLDAGCGTGWYSMHAQSQGARVVAYDPSQGMADVARRAIGPPARVLHCMTGELGQSIGDQQFDIVLSSLVLHYVRDLASEFTLLRQRVRDDGCMVVSMHHPLLHFERIQNPGYFASEGVQGNWPGVEQAIRYVRRPLGAITRAIREAGLLIESLVEPRPDPKMLEIEPAAYNRLARVPGFIHFRLVPASASGWRARAEQHQPPR